MKLSLSLFSAKAEQNISNLRKRPSLVPTGSRGAEKKERKTPKPTKVEDFEEQQAMKAVLTELVGLLLDHEQLPEAQVERLDLESLQLLSNFSFMISKVVLPSGEQLKPALASLNQAIRSGEEKKRRNEERIKYVFKRVNKLILKSFMAEHGLSNEDESLAMKMAIEFYFFGGKSLKSGENKPELERYHTLLFKPSNMYRADLKELFGHFSYGVTFKKALEEEFLQEYKAKRHTKIADYLRDLKEEIFYSSNQSDPSILKHKLSRLPWSVAEVQKGVSLLAAMLPQ